MPRKKSDIKLKGNRDKARYVASVTGFTIKDVFAIITAADQYELNELMKAIPVKTRNYTIFPKRRMPRKIYDGIHHKYGYTKAHYTLDVRPSGIMKEALKNTSPDLRDTSDYK